MNNVRRVNSTFNSTGFRTNDLGRETGRTLTESAALFVSNELLVNPHQWVAVSNPYKKRALLHACDNCGVVRSENTQIKNCKAEPEQNIITSALLVINH